ncbi:Fic family protein [Candidatus Microgenomates bacterium]|nr:Fic family protein [Candidatus Microgenomates bacterium]
MLIPPKYRITKKIVLLLGKVEANGAAIAETKIPYILEDHIRQESVLGSALFSARIEGNTLSKEEVFNQPLNARRDKNRIEVVNLRRAYNFVLQSFQGGKRLSKKDILKLHKMAMSNVIRGEYPGHFRTGQEGVFDLSGNIIYHAPPPSEIKNLLDQLVDYANSNREKLSTVKALLVHLVFEKIHPFSDGNGRVGRLLQLAVLVNTGHGMRGFANVEEIIDRNKELYYLALEEATSSDATNFVELMLGFLVEATTRAKQTLEEKSKGFNALDLLLPRRRELVEIVREQRLVSLDFLHRRFLQISPRLLSYDLKCLMDQGFIVKIGKTRGALYAPKL